MTPANKLKDIKLPPTVTKPKAPVWDGPESDTPNGGVTQGLLARFLTCRERARLYLVDGLRVADSFNHRLFFGSAWHVCEEALATGVPSRRWESDLIEFANVQAKKFPFDRDKIEHWTEVVRVTFPHYVEHWSKHPDTVDRTPLLQEQTFAVPYQLPSGRTVILRGRWDSVDLRGTGKSRGIWLGENKTKGDIDEQKIRRQLSWDLQTMTYLVALEVGICPTCRGMWTVEKATFLDESPDTCPNCGGHFTHPHIRVTEWPTPNDYPTTPILGVYYNVIRRPLSGGKGNIVRRKPTKGSKCPKCKGNRTVKNTSPPWDSECPKCSGTGRVNAKRGETAAEFYARLGDYVKREPETYFMRWECRVLPGDILRFRRECLDPILEQLCDWWSWLNDGSYRGPFEDSKRDSKVARRDAVVCYSIHWRTPYGLASPLLQGGYDDIDALLDTGSTAWMQRVSDVFPELRD